MQRENFTISVGKDQVSIEKFMQAVQNGNDEEMGTFYGYPNTAGRVFVAPRAL